ncbi:YjjG family noncanonical pyrimidine nucleotidase [Flavobacterium terrigena]|uniref:Putative hydrolase of the HAD superfamily n=1 Tax=Flavobacterium terrigena TaxID=402734 RepID=A0A1H6WSE3_9FLAO|nr:YjjG family noncanonical pyrimidine nucleotidase [Flavobacterium terrigena]SEJ18776.1 putative hydrolase of the HAD superfamily [Flavobacterium terrigena]
MNEIKHIFFDLDHTLWDFEKNAALAFEKIFEELDFEIDSQEFITTYNPINVAYWKLYERNEIDQESLRVNRLKDAFEAIDYPISLEQINTISNLFIAYLTTNNHLIDGTIETLEYLKDNYKLHIITNGFSFVQEVKLQKSNLDKYFITITNSELAGHKKPHENIFQYALSLANASKNQSIMIGDSIEADVLGAINFGMKAVYFNPANEHVSHEEIIQIQKLTQLKNIL